MPNYMNISAPACLVGSGRSGTTLITALLRRHPQVQALGETGNVVYSTLYHLERTLPLCGPAYDKASAPAAAVKQVQRTLIDLFPADEPRWFHKPIMLPAVRRLFQADAPFAAWFWDAGARLFPEGKWFTVIRDWRDVARSSMRRWNWTPEVATRSQIRLAEMLLHADNRLGLILDFQTLVDDPEGTARRLLDFLELSWDPACMSAFDIAHAPNREAGAADTMPGMRERNFAHEADATMFGSPLMDRLQKQLRERITP